MRAFGVFFLLFLALVATRDARADFREAAAYSAAHKGVTFVVVQYGRIVFEDYPNGGRPDVRYRLASGSKSFWGVVAAALVQDGKLNLDEPVARHLTEWAADGRREITMRQLLSLTSGIDSPRTRGDVPSFAGSIATPLVTKPGTKFAYSGVPFQVFGAWFTRAVRRAPAEYLQARVLDLIGVRAEWRSVAGGDTQMAGGASMTARDWARFGEFVRQGGVVNGRRIVDAVTLQTNFQGSVANPGYGLTWWLKPATGADISQIPQFRLATDIVNAPAVPSDLIMAAGAGKQRLYIAPSLKLVVVRQAEKSFFDGENGDGAYSDAELWRLLRR